MKAIKEIMSWVVPIIIGLLVAWLIKTYVFSMVKVDGPSMEPNLTNNERVFALKQSTVHRLSVVVFDAGGVDPNAKNGTDYVKRVIGMPGDTVSSKNGDIYVNGKKINQSFISSSERGSGTGNWDLKSLSSSTSSTWVNNRNVVKVPKGTYFVLGDHRSVSNDGRYWGFVPESKIFGVVKVPVWASTKQIRYNINQIYKQYDDVEQAKAAD